MWLQGPKPYHKGVVLFKKHVLIPRKPTSKIILSGPENSLSRKVLEEELRGFGDSQSNSGKSIAPNASASPPARTSGPSPTLNPTQEKLILEKEKEIKGHYGEVNRLRGQMIELTYDSDGIFFRKNPNHSRLRVMARRVMVLDHEIKFLYDSISHIREFGQTPNQHLEQNIIKVCGWLKNIVKWENYLRQAKSYHNKNGCFRNPARVEELKKNMEEIDQFVKDHGAG